MGVSERGFVFADATLKNSNFFLKFLNNCYSKNENKFIIFLEKKNNYLPRVFLGLPDPWNPLTRSFCDPPLVEFLKNKSKKQY